MKIRLTDITATGLVITEVIPQLALNERLSTGFNHGIEFLEGLNVSLTVFKSPTGAETKGIVTSRYRQPCSRCAEGAERELTLPTNFYLQQRPEAIKGTEVEEYEDDIGITYYDGDHVDLEDLIQETIILSLSLYWHPDEDREGKCRLCHKLVSNLIKEKSAPNKNASFADLLKKAGV